MTWTRVNRVSLTGQTRLGKDDADVHAVVSEVGRAERPLLKTFERGWRRVRGVDILHRPDHRRLE